jgi:hypothetical protein
VYSWRWIDSLDGVDHDLIPPWYGAVLATVGLVVYHVSHDGYGDCFHCESRLRLLSLTPEERERWVVSNMRSDSWFSI